MSANILNEKQKKYYLMIHFENGEIIIMFVYILIKTMGNSTKPLDITDNKSVIAAIKGMMNKLSKRYIVITFVDYVHFVLNMFHNMNQKR